MRLLQALILSLFIHLLMSWGSQYIPATVTQVTNLEIELQDNRENDPEKYRDEKGKTRQVVRQALIPDSLKLQDNDDPIRFLSEKTQRVKKQTQAKISGLTQNRSANNGNSAQAKTQNPTQGQSQKVDQKLSDSSMQDSAELRRNDLQSPIFPAKLGPSASSDRGSENNFDSGFSTLSENLNADIAIGNMTALNTDQYLYYSFFNRVSELIYLRWESRVQDAIVRFRNLLAQGSDRPWVTQMNIWLYPNGEFHSAHLMKSSGIPGFDQAAAGAFREARFFPNPPQELVEEDGFIRLKYSFHVRNPKVLVRSQ